MFHFKFVMDNFHASAMSGPFTEANMRAKWLPYYCPPDIQIGFAPNPGQFPIYPNNALIVGKQDIGWWNHYVQNYTEDFQVYKGRYWSTGPNFDQHRPIERYVPLVVYSEFQKQYMKDLNYPEHLIHIIPNMVDSEIFYPRPKGNEIIVGWIGHDLNGLLKGPEVMPFLARRFPHIRFEMIMAPPPTNQEGWLNDHPPNLLIRTNVPHDQMADIISRWHVLVCGSKSETFSNQIAEAMSCGVPVIAAAMGAIYHTAPSQRLIFDVNWGSPPYWWLPEALEKYATALHEVISSAAYRDSLSIKAINDSKRFSPQEVCKKWYDFIYLCREIVERGE
ncbi:glycosyltransferase family 4 protein [Paenibacillus favisporus]|uniref:glycosyltransferase family 4 protein n=1 Tax=Paenibacillus favisporus TaxID=221028 RepID=UPI0013D51324|nr:glycosyltransferase family 4 protein [Paenibacillus favisporus]